MTVSKDLQMIAIRRLSIRIRFSRIARKKISQSIKCSSLIFGSAIPAVSKKIYLIQTAKVNSGMSLKNSNYSSLFVVID